jgi:hypothetical protein
MKKLTNMTVQDWYRVVLSLTWGLGIMLALGCLVVLAWGAIELLRIL